MERRTNTARWIESAGRWQINVQRDGRRRSFYSSTPGRKGQREANAKADAWLVDGIEKAGRRVSELYAEYIASQKESTSRSHWRGVVSRYNTHIGPQIGHKRIDKLTEQDLQDIINRAYARQGLAAKTLGNIRADLVSFLRFCRRANAATLTPEGLTIPASAKRPHKSVVLPADLLKLFNVETTLFRGQRVPEPYIHAFRLEVLTGLRPGEIAGLTWQDICQGEIHLHQAINYFGEITQGKNKNAVRCVVLSALAAAELEAQREITGGEASVFAISSQQTYYKHWLRYLASNDMKRVTPYELRHTFVSIAKQLPEGMVKSIVGHSQSMDTFGVYGHEIEGDASETAERINSIFTGLLGRNG